MNDKYAIVASPEIEGFSPDAYIETEDAEGTWQFAKVYPDKPGELAAELVRRANAMCAVESLCRSVASNKECESPRRAMANAVLAILNTALSVKEEM